MLNSLFSLVNTNKGKFKSEKQSMFFMDIYDGLYTITQTYYKNNFTWDFYFDKDGIQKVTKTTAKGGCVIFWENTEDHLEMLNKKALAKEDAKKEDAKQYFRQCHDYTLPILTELYYTYSILCSLNLTSEFFMHRDSINQNKEIVNNKINSEMSAYQDAIKWTIEYI